MSEERIDLKGVLDFIVGHEDGFQRQVQLLDLGEQHQPRALGRFPVTIANRMEDRNQSLIIANRDKRGR